MISMQMSNFGAICPCLAAVLNGCLLARMMFKIDFMHFQFYGAIFWSPCFSQKAASKSGLCGETVIAKSDSTKL